MLSDLVIDTNVLLHGSNPSEARFRDTTRFLIALLGSLAVLCIDQGFSTNLARNRSQIGAEYLTHLRAGTLGFTIVQQLASHGRIKEVSRIVGQREAKIIRLTVRDKTDRIFIRVTVNSVEQILVSHDFEHFDDGTSRTLWRGLGIRILDSAGGSSLLVE